VKVKKYQKEEMVVEQQLLVFYLMKIKVEYYLLNELLKIVENLIEGYFHKVNQN
jgi:hypothetical protein